LFHCLSIFFADVFSVYFFRQFLGSVEVGLLQACGFIATLASIAACMVCRIPFRSESHSITFRLVRSMTVGTVDNQRSSCLGCFQLLAGRMSMRTAVVSFKSGRSRASATPALCRSLSFCALMSADARTLLQLSLCSKCWVFELSIVACLAALRAIVASCWGTGTS